MQICPNLADPRRLRSPILRHCAKPNWVVYAKQPFGDPKAVLAYLSRFTRTAKIASQTIA